MSVGTVRTGQCLSWLESGAGLGSWVSRWLPASAELSLSITVSAGSTVKVTDLPSSAHASSVSTNRDTKGWGPGYV